MKNIENSASFDHAADLLHRTTDSLPWSCGLHRTLRGDWLGHALHPMLTDFVEGPWMAASFLDVFGPPDSRRAAQRLLGFGLLNAIPTHLAGLSEWREETRPEQRRVGLTHFMTASSATTLYLISYLLRTAGRDRLGRSFGIAAGSVAMVDGYLGGHMSHVRAVAGGEKK